MSAYIWSRLALGVALASLLLSVVGCGRPPPRRYYTLTYPIAGARFDTLPLTVRVKDLVVRDTYRGTGLVFRPDVHEIRFPKGQRWSERPQKMVTALLRDHFRATGLVRQVTDRLGQIEPDYTLAGEVEALEVFDVGTERYARVAVALSLVRFSDDEVVWRHRFDGRRPVGTGTVRGSVRVMSGLLAREFDLAFDELSRYLADPVAYRVLKVKKAPPIQTSSEDGVIMPLALASAAEHPQLLADDTAMPSGFGAVFLPALSHGEHEPVVVVRGASGAVMEGRMGCRMVLPPGLYDVRYGSGAEAQQGHARVRVVDGKTTVVPAIWAALEIEVVNPQFVPFRGTYELVRMSSREDVGVGFGADALQGETLRSWVLAPGLYKIIRAGGTYRDRTDFATVRLVGGALTRFTLVVDPVTGDFEGAGEVDPADSVAMDRSWRFRGVLGGDLSFNQTDNQVGEQEGLSVGVDLFFDGSATWARDAHLWVTNLEFEEGQLRPADRDTFRNHTDRLFAHTIYTYHLWPWLGPYARFGLETKMLPRYEEFDAPTDVDEVDEAGVVVKSHRGVDRVVIGGSFAPMDLKQGVGGNLRALRSRRLQLDLRLGLGAVQNLNGGLLDLQSGETSDQLVPVDNNDSFGIEGTVVGHGVLVRRVTLSTEFDGLLPFGDDDAAIFTWRNQISLRLATFVSLSYRFNATRNPNLGLGDDVQTEHDVQLRFSYTLF